MTTFEPKTNRRADTTPRMPTPEPPAASEPQSLSQAVQAAVLGIDEGTLRPVARRDAGLAFLPKTLLALLSYCYARGIYGSRDVEDTLRRDRHFREMCRGEFPEARLISRFRRENWTALHRCLEAALRFQVELQVRMGAITRMREEHLAEEARRRIVMAMFIDNVELNGD